MLDAATMLERLASEQDFLAPPCSHPRCPEACAPTVAIALAATRGEAARTVDALSPLMANDGERDFVAAQVHLLTTAENTSDTLRTWAAGWRTLAESLPKEAP